MSLPQEVDTNDIKCAAPKACLFTLLVYAREMQRLPFLIEMLEVIGTKFPCRIIFIQLLADASGDFLKIDTVSQTLGGIPFQQENCEVFTIQCASSVKSKVPLLILPYLVPDLPIYLWWADDLSPQDEALNTLLRISSRIIVDLGQAQDWRMTCRKILELTQQSQKEVVDLNWARMTGWRNTLAKIFDTEDRLQHLIHSSLIQITYNEKNGATCPGNKIQAVYMQGWIAAQLGWTFKSMGPQNGGLLVDYEFEGKTIHVHITTCYDENALPGSILTFEISSMHEYFYSLARSPLQSQVVIHIATPEECFMPLSIPLQDCYLSTPLIRELIYAPVSDHYRHMLDLISGYCL